MGDHEPRSSTHANRPGRTGPHRASAKGQRALARRRASPAARTRRRGGDLVARYRDPEPRKRTGWHSRHRHRTGPRGLSRPRDAQGRARSHPGRRQRSIGAAGVGAASQARRATQRLEADYNALATEVAVLAAALHGLPAPPQAAAPKPAAKATPSAKPTPVTKQLEKAKGRDKETPAIPAKTMTPHVAGPPSLDFGKALPGTTHELTGVLFNLVDHGASAKVSLSGSPAFKLQSSPHQLVKRGEQPPVGSQDIVVRFAAPTPRGSHHGNVRR